MSWILFPIRIANGVYGTCCSRIITQTDDYHVDRPLFFACRQDRDTFCANVQSGKGKVFQCLLQHKQEARMDPKVCDLIIRQ